ncbi:MAG: hypothetical protein ACPIOQ_17590, partial [Promethearchaeia archaeon]
MVRHSPPVFVEYHVRGAPVQDKFVSRHSQNSVFRLAKRQTIHKAESEAAPSSSLEQGANILPRDELLLAKAQHLLPLPGVTGALTDRPTVRDLAGPESETQQRWLLRQERQLQQLKQAERLFHSPPRPGAGSGCSESSNRSAQRRGREVRGRRGTGRGRCGLRGNENRAQGDRSKIDQQCSSAGGVVQLAERLREMEVENAALRAQLGVSSIGRRSESGAQVAPDSDMHSMSDPDTVPVRAPDQFANRDSDARDHDGEFTRIFVTCATYTHTHISVQNPHTHTVEEASSPRSHRYWAMTKAKAFCSSTVVSASKLPPANAPDPASVAVPPADMGGLDGYDLDVGRTLEVEGSQDAGGLHSQKLVGSVTREEKRKQLAARKQRREMEATDVTGAAGEATPQGASV